MVAPQALYGTVAIELPMPFCQEKEEQGIYIDMGVTSVWGRAVGIVWGFRTFIRGFDKVQHKNSSIYREKGKQRIMGWDIYIY